MNHPRFARKDISGDSSGRMKRAHAASNAPTVPDADKMQRNAARQEALHQTERPGQVPGPFNSARYDFYFTSTNSMGAPTGASFTTRCGAAVVMYIVDGA